MNYINTSDIKKEYIKIVYIYFECNLKTNKFKIKFNLLFTWYTLYSPCIISVDNYEYSIREYTIFD